MSKVNIIETESTLTDRYQTTVPEPIRKALKLKKRDKIHYAIKPDGSVILKRAENDQSDPIIDNFLNFLVNDLEKNPENIKAVNPDLTNRIESLVKNVKIDLNEKLSEKDE